MKKTMALFLVLLLGISMLVPVLAGAEEETVDVVWWYYEDMDGQIKQIFEPMWAAYEGKGNVNLIFEHVGQDSFHDKLLTALVAGDGPDIYKMNPSWLPELLGIDAVLQLDDYVKEFDAVKNGEIPDSVMTMAYANQEHLYTMPYSNVVLYLYCRKDLFEAAGVDYPTTMDEFYDACEKLTRDTDGDGVIDTYGFAMRGAAGGHNMWAGLTFNAAEGVSYIDAEGNVAFNTPEVIEANQRYLDLFRNGYAPPTAPTDGMKEIMQNFKSGIAAMVCHHVGSSPDLLEAVGADNLVVIPIPSNNGVQFVPMDPSNVAVNANTKNPEAVMTVLEWLCSPAFQSTFCKEVGQVPWLKSVMAEEYYQTNMFQKPSIDSVDAAVAVPVINPMATFTGQVWPQTMQRALIGEITSAEMIQILADTLQQ